MTSMEGSDMTTNIDVNAVIQLASYTRRAIDAQDVHVQDQLNAAVDAGDMNWSFEDGDEGVPIAVIVVGGYRLAEIDLRALVPLDDL